MLIILKAKLKHDNNAYNRLDIFCQSKKNSGSNNTFSKKLLQKKIQKALHLNTKKTQ